MRGLVCKDYFCSDSYGSIPYTTVYVCVCANVCMYYVCTYECKHVCMYVYVCLYVCVYAHVTGDRQAAARCRLLARQAREKALPAARERALLAAMLDPRWEKRPAAEELARDLGDLVSGRCGRLEGPVSSP